MRCARTVRKVGRFLPKQRHFFHILIILAIRKCGERQREVYQKEFRTAHLNFGTRKSCNICEGIRAYPEIQQQCAMCSEN